MSLPHEDVTSDAYFRDVLGNLYKNGGSKGATVRFGLTGKGVHPNYQCETIDGDTFNYLGMTHTPDFTTPNGYDDDKLTEKNYSIADIQAYIKKLSGK